MYVYIYIYVCIYIYISRTPPQKNVCLGENMNISQDGVGWWVGGNYGGGLWVGRGGWVGCREGSQDHMTDKPN